MLKKRLVKSGAAMVMAASMLAGLAGCGGSGNGGADQTTQAPASTQSPGTEGTTAAAAESSQETTAAAGKEETIKVMVWDRGDAAPGTTAENNKLTDWIKEQMKTLYNINVEYVAVPRSSSDDKLNIMMSGGNAPDIVFTYSQSIFNNYAKNGGLADLTEAVAAHGADITKFVGEAQSMGIIDGKQYAVMKQRGEESPRHTAYIRQDWLDALGMEMPTTKAELFAYLEAVKEQNPGNVDNVIPWAMSGRNDTEKGYLNFIGSYAELKDDKEAYIYNEMYMTVAPGAVDGIKALNELYNKGLLSKDFATDTTEDIYKAQVTAGNVGFVLDDSTRPFDYIKILTPQLGHRTFVPVSCFELADGSYRTPFEPRHGMFIMIPKTSEKKADACIKFLNWQADPEVAENIGYTPEHERDELGVPVRPTQEELNAQGYPGTPDDLTIVNLALEYTTKKDAIIGKNLKENTWEERDFFETLYEVRNTGKFRFPVFPEISQAEADYGKNMEDLMIEYVYRLISCPTDQFDKLQESEYNNLVNGGLQKILDDRAAYYDSVN